VYGIVTHTHTHTHRTLHNAHSPHLTSSHSNNPPPSYTSHLPPPSSLPPPPPFLLPSADDLIGQYSISVGNIRSGYRMVPLLNPDSTIVGTAYIFAKFTLVDA
jgi:hypothetical protein